MLKENTKWIFNEEKNLIFVGENCFLHQYDQDLDLKQVSYDMSFNNNNLLNRVTNKIIMSNFSDNIMIMKTLKNELILYSIPLKKVILVFQSDRHI